MTQNFTKDPQSTLDYQINWLDWLGTDTIATSAWTVDTGITISTSTNTTTTATVWLAGGTSGESYTATNTIVTAAARTEQRSIVIYVENEARTGVAYLIRRWRRLVNDTSGSVWSDAEAANILDLYRYNLWGHELEIKPETSGGSTVYKRYLVGYTDLESVVSGTAAWRVYDVDGTVIGTANYTVDWQRGVVTFTADQAGSARYVDARSYDVNGAAAYGWRELIGAKAGLYRFTADGASYDRNQWFDHCERMASKFEVNSIFTVE
jgi:hypothetical protein